MTNENPPTELRTERLHLRPFQLEDVDDVFEYASDPEWAPYLPIPQPYQRHDAEEFIAKQVLASWGNEPCMGRSAGRKGSSADCPSGSTRRTKEPSLATR